MIILTQISNNKSKLTINFNKRMKVYKMKSIPWKGNIKVWLLNNLLCWNNNKGKYK